MDYGFFKQLEREEAKELFNSYLMDERQNFHIFKDVFNKERILLDFTLESNIAVFLWMKSNVNIIRRNEDESLPLWLRETEIYKKGLFMFDETSNNALLHIAYYFGECFVRSYEKLSWGIGRPHTNEFNMPVVTGFDFKIQLAPIVVCNNILRGLISGEDTSIIQKALDTWESYVK